MINRIILVGVLLLSTKLFSITIIDDRLFKLLEILLFLFFLCNVIVNYRVRENERFRQEIILIILIPFFSVISSFLVHEQNPLLSVYMLRYQSMFLFYFYLQQFRYDARFVRQIVVGMGFIWAMIVVLQQFVFREIVFATRIDDYFSGVALENRSGYIRYMIAGSDYSLLAIAIVWGNVIASKRMMVNLLLLIIMFVGLYINMTRQLMLAACVIIIFQLMFVKNRNAKFIGITFVTISMLVFLVYGDELFGGIYQKTIYDLYNSVRYESAHFYLFEFWKHPLTLFLGNGVEHISSEYGYVMQEIYATKGYFRSDVGIIGVFNKFGVMYLIVVVMLMVKILKTVVKTRSAYFSYYIAILSLSLMIFPFDNVLRTTVFCVFLYLVDVENNKRDCIE